MVYPGQANKPALQRFTACETRVQTVDLRVAAARNPVLPMMGNPITPYFDVLKHYCVLFTDTGFWKALMSNVATRSTPSSDMPT